ncbi:MAG: aspartyl protease family protein [Gemmatimonadales bacterium]
MTPYLVLLASLVGLIAPRTASGQVLADTLVKRILAGASRLVLPEDSVVLRLVGAPTLPLVEVSVNGTGPYRFLIDLGSDVTLLRRDVVDASNSAVLVERPTTDIVHVDAIGLGNAQLEDLTVGSYDELDVDGVLGYNVLQYSSFTLDFPRQRLVLHRRVLPVPDGVTVFSYELHDGHRPYVMVAVGSDSLLVNLDTGASEFMTIPPDLQARLRWSTPPAPGRTTINNQTGRSRVDEGRLAGTLRLGQLMVESPLVYVNPDAEDAWIGAGAMRQAVWTFVPAQRRVQVTVPMVQR